MATPAAVHHGSPSYAPPVGAAVSAELDYRPSYLAAAIAATMVFVLYLVTLAPSTAMWDTSEYIAAAYTLGIPHPPGNPFFVLIGRVFTLLPIADSIAVRINVLAALSSAIAAGMWFLTTERVLVHWLPERWQRITGGALATLIGATAFTVWNQSVVNEKVYTVSLAIFAVVGWLTVRWCDDPETAKADRLLILIAYLLGLGYANHPAGMLPLPAVGLAVLARYPRILLRWRLLLALAGATFLGVTPFATQPIRSAHFPAINEGEPTGCATEFAWSCVADSTGRARFKYNFDRGQYGKPELSQRQAPLGAQIGMWWLYFKWQWMRDADGNNGGLQTMLAGLFFGLGLLGGYVHWRRDRRSFWFFGPLVFTLTLALIYYLNFKYGASQAPELENSVPREVRDRDYFYLWSFSAWSVWAALGLVFLWESLAAMLGAERTRVGREVVEVPHRRSWMLTSPILALAFIPLLVNWTDASRAGQTDTRDFAHDLLNSVEPYGILVTVGDNDTFPLWYAQEVEGIRKDVLIANTSLLNTDWYVRQMIRRPVYEYDAAKGPAVYRERQWPKPTGSALSYTLAQADAVPIYVELGGPQSFRACNVSAVIDPRNLANQVLEKADVMVLQMIKDNCNERAMYFSRTSAGYGQSLGLGSYLLTQGLARKLLTEQPTPGRDTVIVPGDGFLDVTRTKRLWNEVYEAPRSLAARKGWPDQPSIGIPWLYLSTGATLGTALQLQGDAAGAQKVLREAEAVAKGVGLGEIFSQLRPQIEGRQPGQTDSPAATAVPLGP